MDRIQLKTNAKSAMRAARPHPVLVALVYVLILAAVQAVISMISGLGDAAAALLAEGSVSLGSAGSLAVALLLPFVGAMVMSFLQLGYVTYTLHVIDHKPAGFGDLFSCAR